MDLQERRRVISELKGVNATDSEIEYALEVLENEPNADVGYAKIIHFCLTGKKIVEEREGGES